MSRTLGKRPTPVAASPERVLRRTVVVAGTDTGAGKTVLTALLLHHLRSQGRSALAMKPFASGSLQDTRLLQALQPGALPDESVTPFFFRAPLTPLVAARRERKRVELDAVLARIQAVRERCEVTLVEGCGGLFAPLGPGYSLVDVIHGVGAETLLVSTDRLGVLHQVLVAAAALRLEGIDLSHTVLMRRGARDESQGTNLRVLREVGASWPVSAIGTIAGRGELSASDIQRAAKKMKKTLAAILTSGISIGTAAGEPVGESRKKVEKHVDGSQGSG